MKIPTLPLEEIERRILRRIFWYKFWRRLAMWTTVFTVLAVLLLLPWLLFVCVYAHP